MQDEEVRVRTGTRTDLPVLRGLYRRPSLSNEGDREALLANPKTLQFSGGALAEGRTRVAVGADGKILGFITSLALGSSVLEVEDLFDEPDRMCRGIGRRLSVRGFLTSVDVGLPRRRRLVIAAATLRWFWTD
jgi:hypothetical protein